MLSRLQWLLAVVCVSSRLINTSNGTADSVRLEKNSYRGIVVAINPSIPEDLNVIDAIRTTWTEASAVLFKATKNRAYFGQIDILVPKTWNQTDYERATNQSYDEADVIIDRPNRLHRHEPYTVQTGQCGDPGTHMHLTPEYLLNDTFNEDFGPKNKTIIHEWAHLRWGVFDEVSRTEPFYLSAARKVEATRCPSSLQGELLELDYNKGFAVPCVYNPNTFLPNSSKCQFTPYFEQEDGLHASMMSHQFIDSVHFFCHDDPNDPLNRHNRDAPNDQNRLCNQRSTWDVIMTSPDFTDDKNLPNATITNVTPVFRLIKPSPFRKFVLVLDVSGSMRGERIIQMRQAVSIFAKQFVAAGDHVAIVTFSRFNRVRYQLAVIETEEDRNALLKHMPTGVGGGTCIGCGINSALHEIDREPDGDCEIIVFTDGEENRRPYVSSTVDKVQNKHCRMNAIFFATDGNAPLQNLVKNTGGKWFFGNVQDLRPLIGAFRQLAANKDGDASQQTSQIHSTSESMMAGNTSEGYVSIDETIGNNTKFTVTWSSGDETPVVVLTAPSGCLYSTNKDVAGQACQGHPLSQIKPEYKSTYFQIPGTAEQGQWLYSVTPSSDQTITITVSSKPRNAKVQPIVVSSGMIQQDMTRPGCAVAQARVTRGGVPVTGAQVIANFEHPDKSLSHLDLFDAGAYPDARANDGTYSRCFNGFTVRGRYSMSVQVTGKKGKLGSDAQSFDSPAAFKPGFIHKNGSVSLNVNGERNKPVPPDEVENPSTNASALDFSRIATSEGFAFNGIVVDSSVDELPPNPISDLKVQQQNVSDPTAGIRLTFTAPGDDYDTGRASNYEIRYTLNDSVSLLNSFEQGNGVHSSQVHSGDLEMPKLAGTSEVFSIETPDLPQNQEVVKIFYSVRGIDDANNTAKPSNIAVLNLYIAPPVIPTLPPIIKLPTASQSSTSPTTTVTSSEAPLEDESVNQPVLKMKQTMFCQNLYMRSYNAAYNAACSRTRHSAFRVGCHRARSALNNAPATYRKMCGVVDYEKACRTAYYNACWNPYCHTCYSPTYQVGGYSLYARGGYWRG